MDLRDFLGRVVSDYDRAEPLSSPTQLLLRDAPEQLASHVPAGIRIQGSGGQGVPTFTPWIGFFDPDETTSARSGIYVVYLFAQDLDTISLILGQGVTALTNEHGAAEARARLFAVAEHVRSGLPPELIETLPQTIDLRSKGTNQRSYEASSIGGIEYDASQLPNEVQLQADLDRMLRLYQAAILVAHDGHLQTGGDSSENGGVTKGGTIDDRPLPGFLPTDDSEYNAHITGKHIRKSRRHETMLQQYADWLKRPGLQLTNKDYPKDLVIREGSTEWLLEAKVVYRGNVTAAVRATLAQLYEYRHFLYRSKPIPRLLALFSEPVGAPFVKYLEGLGVESVWREQDRWRGTHAALEAQLAQS